MAVLVAGASGGGLVLDCCIGGGLTAGWLMSSAGAGAGTVELTDDDGGHGVELDTDAGAGTEA